MIGVLLSIPGPIADTTRVTGWYSSPFVTFTVTSPMGTSSENCPRAWK